MVSLFGLFRFVFLPLGQQPLGTMTFFDWYYYGAVVGGWVLFLLLALISALWLFFDSSKRRLPAVGWRLAMVVMLLLLLPTLAFRFTVVDTDWKIFQTMRALGGGCLVEILRAQFPEALATNSSRTCDELLRTLPPLTPHGEVIFFLGILGGILAPVVALGYFISYQGMVGCPYGHVYEAVLPSCPECAARERKYAPAGFPSGSVSLGGRGVPPVVVEGPPPKPAKPTVQYAWLVDLSNNRRYDICQGTTYIGRSTEKSDIVLSDPAVSRLHAQIREAHGHFTLADLDSHSGTLLNGKRIRAPQVLQNGDRITLGDTILQFVSTR